MSCKEELACCDHIAEFPRIKILGDNGADLLDPKSANHIDHSGISLSTRIDNRNRELSIEIRRVLLTASDSGDYIIDVNANMVDMLSTDGMRHFYLKLSNEDTDTISLIIENSTTKRLELNGEIWKEYDSVEFSHIIRK